LFGMFWYTFTTIRYRLQTLWVGKGSI
jgi:hypothetical protein